MADIAKAMPLPGKARSPDMPFFPTYLIPLSPWAFTSSGICINCNPMRTSKYITIALHVIIWSVLLLIPYLVAHPPDGYKVGDIPGIFLTESDLIHIVMFYGNALYLYPKLCNRRHWY